MLRNSLAKLRFSLSTASYYTLITTIVVTLLVGCFVAVVLIMKTQAYSKFERSIDVFVNAVQWEYRAIMYDGVDKTGLLAPHHRTIASLEGMTKEGGLLVRYPNNGDFKESVFPLADLRIINVKVAASIVNQYKLSTIYLDIYKSLESEENVVVVWLENGEPLNLKLINNGVAIPEESPPTNIVNILMAAYLWKQL